MNEIDSVEQLLTLARAELEPSLSERARSRAALGLSPRPAAAPGALVAERAPRGWAALRASGKTGAVLALVLVGASFGAGYWLARRDAALDGAERARSAAAGAAVPAALSEVEPAPSETPPSVPAPAAPAKAEPVAAVHTPSASSHKRSAARAAPPLAAAPMAAASPVDELSLLRRVERSLRAEDPALALALLNELDERFPDSALAEERRAAAVLAHCEQADPGARLRAENFLRDRPLSVYAERVRTACHLSGAAEAPLGEGSHAAGHE